MKTEKLLRIFFMNVKVEFSPQSPAATPWGAYNRRKQHIWIDSDLSLEQRAETLFHEILHEAYFHINRNVDEDEINPLSEWLYGILEQNGFMDKLVEFCKIEGGG